MTDRVVVVRTTRKVIVSEVEPRRVLVRGTGAQGPAGPPGVPGTGYTYVEHTQASPSSAWVIDHNLGRLVHVTVFVPSGTEVEADVVHNTANQVVINFPTPETGSAFIS